MKRTILGLVLGLACGLGAHYAFYFAQRPHPTSDGESQWEWMRNDLRLDDAQVARIKALHDRSSPELLALASRVARMREELAAFEKARLSSAPVDFLEFARFVEQKRQLDRECVDSTRRLVAATAGVMTADQREHYLMLLGPAFQADRAAVLN